PAVIVIPWFAPRPAALKFTPRFPALVTAPDPLTQCGLPPDARAAGPSAVRASVVRAIVVSRRVIRIVTGSPPARGAARRVVVGARRLWPKRPWLLGREAPVGYDVWGTTCPRRLFR